MDLFPQDFISGFINLNIRFSKNFLRSLWSINIVYLAKKKFCAILGQKTTCYLMILQSFFLNEKSFLENLVLFLFLFLKCWIKQSRKRLPGLVWIIGEEKQMYFLKKNIFFLYSNGHQQWLLYYTVQQPPHNFWSKNSLLRGQTSWKLEI